MRVGMGRNLKFALILTASTIALTLTIAPSIALQSANYKMSGAFQMLHSENYVLSISPISSSSESGNYSLLSSIWWYPEYSHPTAMGFVIGDVDGDGDVDFNDLIAVLNLILSNGYNPAADVDGDGNIDFNDLIGVLNIILAG